MHYLGDFESQRENSNTGCVTRYSWIAKIAHMSIDSLTLILVITVFFITIVCVKDITDTLADVREVVPKASRSLADLDTLMPEVKKTLTLVQNICTNPQFKIYCDPR